MENEGRMLVPAKKPWLHRLPSGSDILGLVMWRLMGSRTGSVTMRGYPLA